jgi:signal transduction histidine kinase
LAQQFLLADPKSLSWEQLLAELARAFGVPGAGAAAPLSASPAVRYRHGPGEEDARLPWQEPPVLARLRSALSAIALPGDRASCLAAPVFGPPGACGLVWLEAPPERVWKPEEGAALVLAGQALAGRLAPDALSMASGDPAHLERRLQDAAQMAARTAHAFDNVLTGILGFTELTLSQLPARSMPASYLAEVLQAARQGTQLTQRLHQFGRCGTPRPGPASLALVAAELEAQLRQTLRTGIQLRVEIPPDLPHVALDAESLRQVLTHLLDNAIEAVTDEGSVSLSARRQELSEADSAEAWGAADAGPHVEVQVLDTGCGLTAEVRRRLFHEPLFTTKPRHSGLGLAIVVRTLQANRGGLVLQPADHRGTRARLFLPIAAPRP